MFVPLHHNMKLFLFHLIIYLSIALFSAACTADKLANPSDDLKIQLQYYYNAASPNQQSLESGLKWYFSYLGATLQKGQLTKAIEWKRNTNSLALVEIDCSKLGFSTPAQTALKRIIQTIKSSPVYQKNSYMDLGRFVVLTLNSSNHYYAITGVYPTFNAFRNAYNFEDTAVIHLNNGASSVTSGNRIIYQTKETITAFQKMAFIALEGTGDVQQGNFEASDFEVFDFMDNGQPRFAIYDENGQLKTAVPTALGEAGKPAKCMWCHESTIQANFVLQHPQSTAFNQNISLKNTYLNTARNQLDSDLSYLLLQEHHFAELLYISFMEPSAARLAQEWKYTLAETQALLQNYSTHIHHEYPQLGNLYNRNEVDDLSPFSVVPTPESAHEASFYEPNF
ncbi:MAG: hypothetical protein ACI976_000728 [Aureispira sp.]|jgi:hypothetical protein